MFRLTKICFQLDATADFMCRGKWGKVDYPPPFGRDAFPEEAYIADIDAKTGASLKVNTASKLYKRSNGPLQWNRGTFQIGKLELMDFDDSS